MRPLSYPAACAQVRRRAASRTGCAAGAHTGFTVPDRAGVWFWACRYCPAVRVQRNPVWRMP